MSDAENEAVVLAAIDAFNDHDVERYLSYHAADATYLEPFVDQALIGPAIGKFFQDFIDACPDARLVTRRMISDKEVVAVENILTGSMAQPDARKGQIRSSFTVREAVFFEFDRQKIRNVRVYLDRKAMQTQLGPAFASLSDVEPHQ